MFVANLFENYISENTLDLVVLYPGRFQPFHLGHKDVFHSLQNQFGRNNVFIATSNKVEPPRSPFNFTDKTILMNAAGIPADRIIETSNPYKFPETRFNPSNSIFIVAIGAPDKERLRPGSTKKDGSPSYYQPFTSLDKCETADKHGYVIIASERKKIITLKGQQIDVSHGTQAREAWNLVRNNPKQRADFLMQMYGKNDQELGRVLDKIPTSMNENKITDPELANTINYAVGHYTNIKDPEQAFMKLVQRSLKHGLETDIAQQKKINNLTREIQQLKQQIANKINEDLPPPENARKTQIAGTVNTYKKANDIFKQHGAKGKALDFGAGLGKGTAELGSDAESYEPYPGPDFKPHYVDVTKIPDNSYNRIVNLNVLNVVPNVGEHRIRDAIVRNIGRVLAPGGMAIITTRGRDVLTIKGTPGEEPMSMISKIGTYQKGFTQAELREYVQSVLGDGFVVNSVKLGPAGVVIKKKENVKEEAAGVGVVKNSKDPRYSMATMGNQNDVTASTLPKMMAGFHLTKRVRPKKK